MTFANVVAHEARQMDAQNRRLAAAELMQRIAARCIDQLIKHGYVQRRDLEDLRKIEREYRASMKETA